MPTRVKICGITRVEDGLAAARAGAHAIGLMFWTPSPRNVSIAQAKEIVAALPPLVTVVAVFVDPDKSLVEEVLREVHPGLLQFHGNEPPEFCRQFGAPYVKAIRVRPGLDLLQYVSRYPDAKALLFDTFVDGIVGGTGRVFDWSLIPANLRVPVILSGGLNAGNVADAINHVRPWAVDVSSGVELSKGVKAAVKIAAFMEGVRSADV